ncbi:MAG: epoxide hydrolase family protein [Sphingomonadaceae bacterium]
MDCRPFRIAIEDDRLAELQRRLSDVRWPGDFANQDWHYGVEEQWLRTAIDYWRDDYDWRAAEAAMNGFPQFMVDLDGIPIHFIHQRSPRADAIALLLTHGWPWTFWDWRGVIGPLADPGDPSVPAFHVVVPSLPGFAFSSPLRTTGIEARRIGQLWRKLMCEVLGYERFGAAGGDWGSMISAELGHAFPDDLIGVNLTLPMLPGLALDSLPDADFAPDEQWMPTRMAEAREATIVHMAVQFREPQTLAYALTDSPVGLAAWLWQRRIAWSDKDGHGRDLDSLCSLASLYWFTNTAATSLRLYREQFDTPYPPLHARERLIGPPTGYMIAPKDLFMFPRSWAERLTNLERWTVLPFGGHFVPAEVPDLVVDEYRAIFGSLR